MKQMYQVGDWVIHNFEIKQVTRTEKGIVREVSCGSFSTSSSSLDDYIRPLTLKSKRYAESIAYSYKRLRELPGSNSLNWPDINRYFSELCLLAIDNAKPKYHEGEINEYLLKAEDFVMKAKEQIENVSSVNGVSLFRR